jgi:hypothetical protein
MNPFFMFATGIEGSSPTLHRDRADEAKHLVSAHEFEIWCNALFLLPFPLHSPAVHQPSPRSVIDLIISRQRR